MGKVLIDFSNGYSGAVSRSIDNMIVAMKNGSGEEIAFGSPVFLQSGSSACVPFDAATSTADNFLGFAVRIPDKTPDTYGSNEGTFGADDPVEVLVRGSTVLRFANAVNPGSKVYIRKSDRAFVTSAGGEGTTLLLPNVTVRTQSDGTNRAEVVLTKRNLM